MIGSIRSALADDGTWLLVDIKARDSFADNVAKNPMAALMYGISVLSCMSSAMSSPDGAGLGTLGLPASRAAEHRRRGRVRATSANSTSTIRSTPSTRSDQNRNVTMTTDDRPDTTDARLSAAVAFDRRSSVAIVTGAASGMGRATAHLFADEGARVVVADIGAERVAAVVDEIVAVHGPDAALGVVCDVSELDELRALVERTVEWAGRLDIVVNNAGISLINSAFQPEGEFETNWARTLDVNLTAHARLIRLAVPHLMASGAGRIVNIASTEAIVTTGRPLGVRGDQGGCRRADQEHGGRAGAPRHHGQLHLPRPDRHRDDRRHRRRREGDVRPSAGAAAALRRNRRRSPT